MLPRFALLIALTTFLSLNSCNKQDSVSKQPPPIKPKPGATLLAADITKLGFIPGKPVAMPVGFKAQRESFLKINEIYWFANGSYVVDDKGILDTVTMQPNEPVSPTAGMTSEQATAYKRMTKDTDIDMNTSQEIGPRIPQEQRNSIIFLT